jgi:hypothetical protein
MPARITAKQAGEIWVYMLNYVVGFFPSNRPLFSNYNVRPAILHSQAVNFQPVQVVARFSVVLSNFTNCRGGNGSAKESLHHSGRCKLPPLALTIYRLATFSSGRSTVKNRSFLR